MSILFVSTSRRREFMRQTNSLDSRAESIGLVPFELLLSVVKE